MAGNVGVDSQRGIRGCRFWHSITVDRAGGMTAALREAEVVRITPSDHQWGLREHDSGRPLAVDNGQRGREAGIERDEGTLLSSVVDFRWRDLLAA